MKTSMNLKRLGLIAALIAILAAPALAQPGPGAAGGPCRWNGDAVAGPGMGQGMRGRAMSAQAPGWALATAEERAAHWSRMRAVKTYDECVAVQTEYRGMIEVRAKEKGIAPPAMRRNVCEMMQAHGVIQ